MFQRREPAKDNRTVRYPLHQGQLRQNRAIRAQRIDSMLQTITSKWSIENGINYQQSQTRVAKNRRLDIERNNFEMLRRISEISSDYAIAKSMEKPTAPPRYNPQRTRELQRIFQGNLQLLKKIQKPPQSEYAVAKMRTEWKKNKKLMQNIAAFPQLSAVRRRSGSIPARYSLNQTINTSLEARRMLPTIAYTINSIEDEDHYENGRTYRMRKNCLINYYRFEVELSFGDEGLNIKADNPQFKSLKMIEIERGEAIEFIRYECAGLLSAVFDRLRFDGQNLFLVGRDFEEEVDLKAIEEKESQQHLFSVQNMRAKLDIIRAKQARHTQASRNKSRLSQKTDNQGEEPSAEAVLP